MKKFQVKLPNLHISNIALFRVIAFLRLAIREKFIAIFSKTKKNFFRESNIPKYDTVQIEWIFKYPCGGHTSTQNILLAG